MKKTQSFSHESIHKLPSRYHCFFVIVIAEELVQRDLKEENEMLCGNKSWTLKKSLKETVSGQ